METTVKRLLTIRGLRSIGQGAMVVDLTLYLRDLHWSGPAIGGVLTAAGLVGAALILAVGVLSDRLGRRPFLLIYEGLTVCAALAASITTYGVVLVLAIVIAGFGRGQSGSAGPFAPAEQAWLAKYVNREKRGYVFSLNNALGFIGMAVGSVLAGIPSLIHGVSPLAQYRPVFMMVAVISVLCTLLLVATKENRQSLNRKIQETSTGATAQFEVTAPGKDEDSTREDTIRHRENLAMFKLAAINTLNGLGAGLTGPMMAYWFSLRYGVSAAAIGTTMAIGFVLTGVFSLISGYLSNRVGMVKTVTVMRIIGSSMMLFLPFMPSFLLASMLFVLRSALNRGAQGNRSALSASLTRDRRRGFATSMNALSMRLPASIGPTITGYLFDVGSLSLPFILTAVLQLANAGLYQWVFQSYDKKPARSGV